MSIFGQFFPYSKTYPIAPADTMTPVPDDVFRAPALLLPRKKPVGPVRIDWEHPLTKNLLVYYYVMPSGLIVDLAAKEPTPYLDTYSVLQGVNGASASFNGSSQNANLGVDHRWAGSGETLAVAYGMIPDSASTLRAIYSKDNSGAGNRSFIHGLNSSSTGQFYTAYFATDANTTQFNSPGSLFAAGDDCIIAHEITATNACNGWFNGNPVTMSVFAGPASSLAVQDNNTVSYLAYRPYPSFNNWYDGSIHWLAGWKNARFTDDQMAELARDPYQFLVPA